MEVEEQQEEVAHDKYAEELAIVLPLEVEGIEEGGKPLGVDAQEDSG